mmetsp:Transcript_73734/g.140376  ORF Transcript_73734/g.140376 Transcript_73734/m.140376 type:complete len:566 (-) Transcript_73734:58-1755(-)
MAPSDQIPVTVLSGCSGSGKTSVIKHLLANCGLRIALIVNDVADISVDLRQLRDPRSRLPLASGAEVVGGCICCTRRQKFLDRMMEITNSSNVDYVLVEAAGVAEPFHVAENFALVEHVRLDTMVTVVDAAAAASLLEVLKFASNLNNSATANIFSEQSLIKHHKIFTPATRLLLEQVRFSNVILLNKCDKIEALAASDLCETLQRLNPDAQVHKCVHGKIHPDTLLNTNSFSMEQAEDSENWFAEARSQTAPVRLLPHDEVWWATFFSKYRGQSAENFPAGGVAEACAKNDVNETDSNGYVALMEAIRLNWHAAVSELIGMRADLNIAARSKVHPLHLAITHGKDTLQILLAAKAEPNCQDVDPDDDPDLTSRTFERRLQHRTPLHYACAAGNADAVSLLVRSRAKLDIQDAQSKSPLHLAIEEGRSEIIDLLLQYQADVNLGNMESGMNNSPLMDAARVGKHDLVAQLISARAEVDKQGKQGMAAVHFAARSGHVAVAQLLVAARADTMQQSQCGTALQLARKNGGGELLRAFDYYGEASTDYGSITSIAMLDASQRAALFLE